MSRALSAVLLAALAIGSACASDPAAPADATSFAYTAEYGNRSPGEADVTYTAANGQTTTEHVTMPWTSETIHVIKGQSYHLDVEAPRRTDAALSCGVHVDSGWSAGQSMESDRCSYTFPDDLNR